MKRTVGPYLAVIADSFRAALASRVLWIAFLAIWVLLAALAPTGYREEFTTTFRWNDFENGTQLKHRLGRALVDPQPRDVAVVALAEHLPEDLQRPLRRVGQGEDVRISLRDFADGFDRLLEDEGWYDPAIWSDALRLRELRELDALAEDEIDDSLRRRRARLRIEAALPGVFRSRASRSILLTYAGHDFPADIAVDKTQFVTLINQWVMPTLINWLLGFILVFLGILVTASIIPDMLQPGSLHLLLSKPVSRPWLLLSKFVGGCAFVFLCVTQLVVGLWLIAGFRLDIWNARLLWCIPVAVFSFSVFYSVSVLAGLRWRSPILAIGVTCVFGAVCIVVGVIGGLFDSLVTRPQSLQGLAVTADHWIASTRGGGLVALDPDTGRRNELIRSNAMGRDRVLPPVALDGRTVVTANVSGGRFNPYGSGSLDLLVLRPDNDWEPQPSLRLPPATTRLVRCGENQLLAVTTGELWLTSRESVLQAVEAGPRTRGDAETDTANLAGWFANFWASRDRDRTDFRPILPDRVALASPADVAASPAGDAVIVATRGRLIRLEPPVSPQRPGETGRRETRETGREMRETGQTPGETGQRTGEAGDGRDSAAWRLTAESIPEGEPSTPIRLGLGGGLLLAARGDEPLRFFDAGTLSPLGEVPWDFRGVPLAVVALGDSRRFLVISDDGRGRVFRLPDDAPDGRSLEAELNLREIEMASYDPADDDPADDRLSVVHHVDRIDRLDPDRLTLSQTVRPQLSGWRLLDRYLVSPLRVIVPPTGELGQTVTAIISGQSGVTIRESGAAEEERVRYRVLRPVISCAGFIAVMLALGCIYFSRRDF